MMLFTSTKMKADAMYGNHSSRPTFMTPAMLSRARLYRVSSASWKRPGTGLSPRLMSTATATRAATLSQR